METLGTLLNDDKQKKTKIQVSLDSELVQNAERKLAQYGMTRSSALSVFYHAIANSDQFPFTPKLSEREIAMQELDDAFANANIPTKSFKNKKEAMEYLKDDTNWQNLYYECSVC